MERQLLRAEGNRPLSVLNAREALFFGCRDDAPVADQTGGRVVKRRINSQRVHEMKLEIWNVEFGMLGFTRTQRFHSKFHIPH
jgi:hypothetical protein